MSLDELQQKDIEYIKEGINDLKRDIRSMNDTFVRRDVHEIKDREVHNKISENTERINSIKEWNKWMFRTVVTTFFGMIGSILYTLLN